MKKKFKNLLIFGSILITASWAFSQDDVIDFDSDRWELGPESRVIEHLGRKSLAGSAVLKDIVFENGVIEVDMAFTGARCFPTIFFRRRKGGQYEEFYIRPHKSGKPDALQYTPVFNGLAGWQLYSGEGYTAGRNIPQKKWIHVKLEVLGTQARVFVGESQKPALVMNNLKHGLSQGAVGVISPPNGVAFFSHFKVRQGNDLTFDKPARVMTPLGMIMDWEISPAIKFNRLDRKKYPVDSLLSGPGWQKVKAEATGLVNIARYVRKGPVVPDCVLARTMIHSEQSRLMPLQFGYSDIVSIFLNGKLLFSGSSVFRSRDPFFQGLVGFFDSVYLPLKKGNNELLLILAESFGGWGFMCKDGDAAYQHESLEEAWELSHKLSYPETVVYDRKRDILYSSNFQSDGNQYISRVSPGGEVIDLEWVTGLKRPTGMVIQGDKLYVVERTGLVEIDILTGRILKKHPAPSPGFINDIALDDEGTFYVSDGQKGQILKFSNEKFSVWKKGREWVGINGLHYNNGVLYAGTSSDSGIKAIPLKNPGAEIQKLAFLGRGAIVDGIESDGQGNLLVSDYNGKVFRITLDGKKTLLLDMTTPKHFCANFAFIPEKKLLVIPTLNDNRLVAFRLKQ